MKALTKPARTRRQEDLQQLSPIEDESSGRVDDFGQESWGGEPTSTTPETSAPLEPDRASRAKMWLMTADFTAVAVGSFVAFVIQAMIRPVPAFGVRDQILLFAVAIPVFGFGAGFNRLYQSRANERLSQEAANVVRAVAVGVGSMLLLAFTIRYKDVSRLWLALMFLSISAVVIAERIGARRVFSRLRRENRLRRRILIIGTDVEAIGMMHRFKRNASLGYDVVGFLGDDDLGEREGVSVLGSMADVEQVLEATGSVGVVVSLSSVTSEEVNRLSRQLTDGGYHVALSSSLNDIDITRIRPQTCDGQTMIYIEPVIRGGWRAVAKRVLDVSMAAGILIATLPLTVGAVIAIKLTSPGKALFVQERVGLNGKTFKIYKLRTMVADAEARKADLMDLNERDGALFKITHDPRITRVGAFLRKTSIDELPQLWCVLRGTMSMVGPRPALPSEAEQWDDEIAERLRVLPGLTGLWQVSGRSDDSFEQYKRMDLYYVHNWSLPHDLSICFQTVGVVLTGKGAA